MNLPSRADRARQWAAVTLVFLAIVTVASVWLALDRQPPPWDYASHLESGIRCLEHVVARDLPAVFARSPFYPPLVPCLAGLVYALRPSDVVFGDVVMLAFLGVGMAATYVLGRRFAGGAGGVIAAVLFGTSPAIVHYTLRFQLDVPLASMVAAFLATLLASEGFTRPGWSLAAGVVLGLGMLTKPPFLVHVAPACLVVLAGTRGRRAWGRASVAGLVAVLVALPWYGPRAFGLWTQIQNRSFKQAEEAGAPSALSSMSLAYYPLSFPPHFGVIAALLLLIGLTVAVRRRCWFVLAGLAPLLVFFALQNKQVRYVLPLAPMAAVVGGLGFSALPGAGRWAAGLAVGAAACLQVWSAAFGTSILSGLPVLGSLVMPVPPPERGDWPQRPILDLIARDARGAPRTVSIMPNHASFSAANFRYYAVRDARPVRVARAWDGEPIGVDYMVLKTGDLGPPWSIDKARRIAERMATDASLARVYPVIGEFALPDGSTATIRARRIPAVLDGTPSELARAIADALRARLGEVMRDVEGLDVVVDYDAGIREGRIKRLEISVAAATVGELKRRQAAVLRLRELRIVVEGALVNPWSAVRERRFDPLDASRLTIERALIDAADLQRFVGQVKGLGRLSLALGRGFVDLRFAMSGPDIAARMRFVEAPDRLFKLIADDVRLGGVTVPSLLVNWIIRNVDPSAGIGSRLPFPAVVRPITVTPGAVRIGMAPDPR